MRRIKLPSCRIDCTLLSDGRGGLPVAAVFEDVDPEDLAAAVGSEQSAADVPYNCLLVRAPDALVLADTGLGAAQHPLGGSGGQLRHEMERVGVAPADIDVVVVSHGHLDHIGGLTKGGEPAFPRARYIISQGEWSYWTSPSVLAGLSELVATPPREQLPPLEAADVLDQISGEVEVADGVRVVPAPGHSPAHLAVEVGESGGLLFAVDAFLHPPAGQPAGLGAGVRSRCRCRGRDPSFAARKGGGAGARDSGVALGRHRSALSSAATIVGRESELAQLDAFVADAEQQGAVFVLEGELGSG